MYRQTDDEIAQRVCHACGQRSMRRLPTPYEYEISHDGRPPIAIRIPDLLMVRCTNQNCPERDSGETSFLDDDATLRLTIETYRQLGLLTPDEIRAGREKLGLTQAELQSLLGLGGNSLSRWEKGRVYQSRSMDRLMRLAFNVPGVIEFLHARPLTLANR